MPNKSFDETNPAMTPGSKKTDGSESILAAGKTPPPQKRHYHFEGKNLPPQE